MLPEGHVSSSDTSSVRVSAASEGVLGTRVRARTHDWATDEPVKDGGTDHAGTPIEMLLGALASCTVTTVRMYASRKGWGLTNARASVEGSRDASGRLATAVVRVELFGELDEPQRQRLLQIARKCPVHRALAGGVHVDVLAG
jgi:putative redox protein